MKKFSKPIEVADVDVAFGARDMKLYLPTLAQIPEEFKDLNDTNYWVNLQCQWFFKGLTKEDFPPIKAGIDYDMALRHLKAIQVSWEPKHEHKVAGVAYLMSLWFEEPVKE